MKSQQTCIVEGEKCVQQMEKVLKLWYRKVHCKFLLKWRHCSGACRYVVFYFFSICKKGTSSLCLPTK
jgi:hypothetical protein